MGCHCRQAQHWKRHLFEQGVQSWIELHWTTIVFFLPAFSLQINFNCLFVCPIRSRICVTNISSEIFLTMISSNFFFWNYFAWKRQLLRIRFLLASGVESLCASRPNVTAGPNGPKSKPATAGVRLGLGGVRSASDWHQQLICLQTYSFFFVGNQGINLTYSSESSAPLRQRRSNLNLSATAAPSTPQN